MKRVFISHSSKDQKTAMAICAALESRGHPCWMSSRDIAPGENYQGAIVRAIRDAGVMVLVFSANANNSDEIKKEMALASHNHLAVIPLRVEDVVPTDAFQYELSTRQWVDAFDDWDRAMSLLADQISRIGSKLPQPTPRPIPRRGSTVTRIAKAGAIALISSAVVVGGVAVYQACVPAPPPLDVDGAIPRQDASVPIEDAGVPIQGAHVTVEDAHVTVEEAHVIVEDAHVPDNHVHPIGHAHPTRPTRPIRPPRNVASVDGGAPSVDAVVPARDGAAFPGEHGSDTFESDEFRCDNLGQKISGNEQIHPDPATRRSMASRGVHRVTGTVELCVAATGSVTGAKIQQTTGYAGYDAALLAAMRAWRFQLYTSGDSSQPACGRVTYTYEFR